VEAGRYDLPAAAIAKLNRPKTAQGEAISSNNAYKPFSIRRMLQAVAVDVRDAVQRAKKAARA
jgi:hypothetical protein